MSKEELIKRCISCSALVNQQTPRYYVVYQIKYDFENGGWYSVKDLSKTNELKKYGTYNGAVKYGLNLYHKYKEKLGEDLEVCIKEELVNVADLEAKLKLSKMNESFEREKKDNAFRFIEELKQQIKELKDKLNG